MNETIENKLNIKDIIYEIIVKQVITDCEISRTKCNNYIYYDMIIHYDIGGSMLALFKYMHTKFGKEVNI